jgi:hypothetical protein
MKGERMANASSFLSTALVFLVVLGVAIAGGFYLYRKTRGGDPRLRRLAFVERTALDGGRHLLLVRRDDVEHLILVGGPIDLVVETGIRAASVDAPIASAAANLEAEGVREETRAMQHARPAGSSGPRLSLSPAVGAPEEETLDLTPMLEAKAAP